MDIIIKKIYKTFNPNSLYIMPHNFIFNVLSLDVYPKSMYGTCNAANPCDCNENNNCLGLTDDGDVKIIINNNLFSYEDIPTGFPDNMKTLKDLLIKSNNPADLTNFLTVKYYFAIKGTTLDIKGTNIMYMKYWYEDLEDPSKSVKLIDAGKEIGTPYQNIVKHGNNSITYKGNDWVFLPMPKNKHILLRKLQTRIDETYQSAGYYPKIWGNCVLRIKAEFNFDLEAYCTYNSTNLTSEPCWLNMVKIFGKGVQLSTVFQEYIKNNYCSDVKTINDLTALESGDKFQKRKLELCACNLNNEKYRDYWSNLGVKGLETAINNPKCLYPYCTMSRFKPFSDGCPNSQCVNIIDIGQADITGDVDFNQYNDCMQKTMNYTPSPYEPDPTKTDPTKTDPTKTDPTKTNPTKTDPTKTDPTKTDPTKTDPTKTDPTKTDSTKTDPTKPVDSSLTDKTFWSKYKWYILGTSGLLILMLVVFIVIKSKKNKRIWTGSGI
jgi:hypothetical protein